MFKLGGLVRAFISGFDLNSGRKTWRAGRSSNRHLSKLKRRGQHSVGQTLMNYADDLRSEASHIKGSGKIRSYRHAARRALANTGFQFDLLEPRTLFSVYHISGSTSINEGSPYNLSLASDNTAISSWTINWGDGTAQTPDLQIIIGNPSTVQHTFDDGTNSFNISAFATDATGQHYANTMTIDPSFGSTGSVSTTLGDLGATVSTAFQSDGKIVAVSTVSGSSFVLKRFNSNGDLDTSFGTGGVAEIEVLNPMQATGLVVQPDGRIVVVGTFGPGNGFVLARLNANGTADSEFGQGGVAYFTQAQISSSFGEMASVALTPDGRIVVGISIDSEPSVVCFNGFGSLDTDFGSNGIATQNLGLSMNVASIAVQTDGSVLIAATCPSLGFTLVEGFDNSGNLNLDGMGAASDTTSAVTATLAIQPNGQILLGIDGTSALPGQVIRFVSGSETYQEIFGLGNPVLSDDTTSTVKLLLQSDGKIIYAMTSPGSDSWIAYRLNFDLTLDPTFGDAGLLSTEIDAAGSLDMGLTSDGDLILAGNTTDTDDYVVQRFYQPSTPVLVENVAPTISISGAATTAQGAAYNLALTASDPGQDTINDWVINWGDGTAASPDIQTFDGDPLAIQHTYASAGAFTISATATDEDGTYAANTLSVTSALNASVNDGQTFAGNLYTFQNVPMIVPIPGLSNTGQNSSGIDLLSEAVDPNFTIVSSPSSTTPTPAYVTSTAGFPFGHWMNDSSTSQWISPQADYTSGDVNDAVGTYVYQTTFDLTGLDPNTVQIIGKWSTDNGGLHILLNGVDVTGDAQSPEGGFTSFTNFAINAGFIAGVNTLQFVVQNDDGTSYNPTGLRVEMSGTANAVYSASVNWGDGSTSTVTLTSGPNQSLNSAGSHTYTSSGVYSPVVTLAGGPRNAIVQTANAGTITVGQVLTSIVITANTPSPAANGTQQFSAVAFDQFGDPMDTQPTFNWTGVGNGYSISSDGLVTAPASTGYYIVRASAEGVSSPTLLVGPKIVIGSVTGTVDSTTHTTANLTATAGGPYGGGTELTYTWMTMNDAPASVSFSDNGDNTANQTTAYFTAAGTYHFVLFVADQDGQTVSSNVTVTVDQSLSAIVATSSQNAPSVGSNQQFSATGCDQFGNVMTTAPEFTWSVTSAYYTISSTGLLTAGAVTNTYSVVASSGGVTSSPLVYGAPVTIVHPAKVVVDGSGTFAELTAQGTDNQGGSDLSYAWSVTSANAENVTFYDNDSITACDEFASFSAAGTYGFLVTITDSDGKTTTSKVNVTVAQMLTSIVALPTTATPTPGGTQQFSATAFDQFSNPLATQPNFIWSVSDSSYSVSAAGLLTTPATAGNYEVVATASGVSSTPLAFSQTVTVGTASTATLDSTTHTTASLSVLGADLDGESALYYTWSTIGNPPGAVSFSDNYTNSAKNTTATFSAAGTYLFLVTITDDNGLTTSAAVSLTVAQTLSGIYIATTDPTPAAHGTQQFTGIAYDQFGNAMVTQPMVAWAVGGSGYTISSAGILTAGATLGSYSVTASLSGITSNAVSYSQMISLTTAATATLDPTATYAVLNTLSTDASGGTDLTYSWTITSGNANKVSFYDNGDNSASQNAAYFGAAGTYTFLVTATNPNGNSTTSSVSITVNQVLAGISISTNQSAPYSAGTQQFAGVAFDQFGNSMATQPSLTWAVDNTGYSISSSGLLSMGSARGEYTVTATGGGITSNSLSYSAVISGSGSGYVAATGTTASLSAYGNDSNGDTDLTYIWSVAGNAPGSVIFSDNASNTANNVTATFSVAGTYMFTVQIIDEDGFETTAQCPLTVNQMKSGIDLTSATPAPAANGTQQFSAITYDQFGFPMTTQPTLTWTVSGAGYTISSTGLLTAGSTPGNCTVTAAIGTSGTTGYVSQSESFSPTLTLKSAATASLDSTGTFAALKALGADVLGGTDLTYTWKLTCGNADNVEFYDNGDNTASSDEVDFYATGTYGFSVTITDPLGASVTSSVNVTVASVVSEVDVTSNDSVPQANGTQQFSATAYDQFGNVISSPAVTWGATGSGYSINSAGLLTAGSTPSAYTVTATINGVAGHADPGSFAPVITTQAAKSYTAGSTSASLSVAATDMTGTSDLQYSWYADGNNSSYVSFSPITANGSSTATFSQGGVYTLICVISNSQGLSVQSKVTVDAAAQLKTIAVTTPTGSGSNATTTTNPVAMPGKTVQFTATGYDQFGNSLGDLSSSVAWSCYSSDGSVSIVGGSVTAGTTPDDYSITATSGSVLGYATMAVAALIPVLHNETLTVSQNGSGSLIPFQADTNGDANNDPYDPAYSAITRQPQHGTVTWELGHINYVADSSYTGSDSFVISTYNGDFNGGDIIVTVSGSVQAPTAPTSILPTTTSGNGRQPRPTDDVSHALAVGQSALIPDYPDKGTDGEVASWNVGDGYVISVGYNGNGYDSNGNAITTNNITAVFDGSSVIITGSADGGSVTVQTSSEKPISVTWSSAASNDVLNVDIDNIVNVTTTSGTTHLNSYNVTGTIQTSGTLDGGILDVLSGSINATGSVSLGQVGEMTGSVTSGSWINVPIRGNAQDNVPSSATGTITAHGSATVSSSDSITSALTITSQTSFVNVSATGNISATITANGGASSVVTDSPSWDHAHTIGEIGGTITANGGSLTVNSAANMTATINGSGLTSASVSSAFKDLTGTVNVSSQTLSVSANNGDIHGTVTNSGGSISVTAAETVSGILSATGGDMSVNATRDITGQISDTNGNITGIFAGGNISGAISDHGGSFVSAYYSYQYGGYVSVAAGEVLSAEMTDAGGNITGIYAGRTISGPITASTGNISTVLSTGELSGLVEADHGLIDGVSVELMSGNITGSAIGDIYSTADITGQITATAGGISSINASRDFKGTVNASGTIGSVSAGRDLSGGSVSGATITEVTAGRDMSTSVTAAQNIETVSVGRALTGNVKATSGHIGSVDAGSNWGDYYTKSGSIGSNNGVTISAGTYIGDVTAESSSGYAASMNNVTITAGNGNIGSVTAVTGLTTVTASATSTTTGQGNIGNISTASGDITGSFTASRGIGTVTASNGAISALLTAGTTIGTILAFNNITGAITAGSNIGNITSQKGGISGNITSTTGNIGAILSDAAISGTITATTGNITSVQAWGDITKNITAGASLGDVWAFGSITGNILVGAGKVEITSWLTLTGNVQVAGDLVVSVDGDMSGTLNSTGGRIDAAVWGTITGDISGHSRIVVWANGGIFSKIISEDGSMLVTSNGDISGGTLTSKLNIFVGVSGELNSSLKTLSSYGTIAKDAENTSSESSASSLEEFYQAILSSSHVETSTPQLILTAFTPPHEYVSSAGKSGTLPNPHYDYYKYLNVKAKAKLATAAGLTDEAKYWTTEADNWYSIYKAEKAQANVGKFTVDATTLSGSPAYSVDYAPPSYLEKADIKLVQAIRGERGGLNSQFDTYQYNHPSDSTQKNPYQKPTNLYPPGYVEDAYNVGLFYGGVLPGSTTGGFIDAPGRTTAGPLSTLEVAAVMTFKGKEYIISMITFQWNADTHSVVAGSIVQHGLPQDEHGSPDVWKQAETNWTSRGGKLIEWFYPEVP